MKNQLPELILASTSPYRKELIAKLGLPFSALKPICDEDSYKEKINNPKDLAVTLAQLKAQSIIDQSDTGSVCVIGGDQVAALGLDILGKPGTKEMAHKQLTKMQGKTHQLITAICVISRVQGKITEKQILDITEIKMRPLSAQEIENYIELDLPLDCAGSYKIEKSGLTLIDQMKSDDFSAIQGVPLIQLTKHLISIGYQIPGSLK